MNPTATSVPSSVGGDTEFVRPGFGLVSFCLVIAVLIVGGATLAVIPTSPDMRVASVPRLIPDEERDETAFEASRAVPLGASSPLEVEVETGGDSISHLDFVIEVDGDVGEDELSISSHDARSGEELARTDVPIKAMSHGALNRIRLDAQRGAERTIVRFERLSDASTHAHVSLAGSAENEMIDGRLRSIDGVSDLRMTLYTSEYSTVGRLHELISRSSSRWAGGSYALMVGGGILALVAVALFLAAIGSVVLAPLDLRHRVGVIAVAVAVAAPSLQLVTMLR